MPVVGTKGAMSSQGFGEFAQASAITNYIEDVFSTYLYTGNGSTQTITNGIDLSTKGGMVITKARSIAYGNILVDTTRGVGNILQTSTTNAQIAESTAVTGVSTTGFSVGSYSNTNGNGQTFASWTFRKQPKFFDVVTYTGNGTAGRTVAHNLGAVPGCIIVKKTDAVGNWDTYHRSIGETQAVQLNTTGAAFSAATNWNNTAPTSTVFTLGTDTGVNENGKTYVAYLFAHDAGGFGLTGTDNVISCGSYTGNGSTSGPVTTLGYEPQWILIKNASATTGGWVIVDNMRGLPVGTNSNVLRANTSGAEVTSVGGLTITATGFQQHDTDPNFNASGNLYIYIAIRRGPMKVPTSGASVFIPIASSAAAGTVLTTGFPIDMQIGRFRDVVNGDNSTVIDRLRGVSTNSTQSGQALITSATSAEAATTNKAWQWSNADFKVATDYGSTSSIYYNFKRAPSFFDEVSYIGTGSNTTQTHNLGVAPEMVIYRRRNTTANWIIYCLYNTAASSNPASNYLNFDANLSSLVTTYYDAPTSSVLNLKSGATNTSGGTYVAYLFATCAGVSKVGSYTGTGTTQQINCGFTSGARFVLIKRTDASLSAWYVWDSARGIVAGNDPYLLLNSTAAEVTSTDYIDTYSAGFEISSTAPAAINASGGKFIFLAIA